MLILCKLTGGRLRWAMEIWQGTSVDVCMRFLLLFDVSSIPISLIDCFLGGLWPWHSHCSEQSQVGTSHLYLRSKSLVPLVVSWLSDKSKG